LSFGLAAVVVSGASVVVLMLKPFLRSLRSVARGRSAIRSLRCA
jgi:hypothetical protein